MACWKCGRANQAARRSSAASQFQPDNENSRKGKIEIYDGTTKEGKAGGRYLTLTGHILPRAPRTLNHRKAEIEALGQRRKTDERAVGVLATTPVTTPLELPPPGSTAESARPARPRSAKDFLRVARQQIHDGNAREAEATLEMAEVRALNEAEGHPATSPEVALIRNARIAVQSGRPDDALHIIDGATPR